ncbi:unnamed protein product [Ectocarpus sp. 13 AM-2016]
MRWDGALSCWMKVVRPLPPGQRALMAGMTSSTTFLLKTSFATSTHLVSVVPAALFLLLRCAARCTVIHRATFFLHAVVLPQAADSLRMLFELCSNPLEVTSAQLSVLAALQ